MFQKIIDFIKYHNAVSIGVSLILVLTFSAMASEDVRNAVIGEEIITEQGIDNSQLLSADIENFDINLKIENVSEDEENYYIDYTLNTIAVRENIWQPVIKSEKFTVNKQGLGNRDLGIYLAEEFSEAVRGEMIYLKEAQRNERERGRTQIVRTTDYTGLIGLTLDLKNKILPGYEPVVKPPEIVVQPQPETIIPPQPLEMFAVPLSEPTSTEPTSTATTTEQSPLRTLPAPEPAPEPQPEPADTTAPVITLVGEAVVTVNVGDTYTDAGATVTDNVDGDITSRIVVVNSVNTSAAGTYTVTYNVSDAAGNAATEVIRTVKVKGD